MMKRGAAKIPLPHHIVEVQEKQIKTAQNMWLSHADKNPKLSIALNAHSFFFSMKIFTFP